MALPCRSFTKFLSTPSARRATRTSRGSNGCGVISIHALREEGDSASPLSTSGRSNFYPRPPRGGRRLTPRPQPWRLSNFYPRPPRGGRPTCWIIWPVSRSFLSTPSARRATHYCLPYFSSKRYFYPRPPRGGRPMLFFSGSKHRKFLSTPSARRATLQRLRRHH